MVVKCKKCGMTIRWFTTTAGKKMPVDEASRPYWKNKQGKHRIVTTDGEVFACDYEGEGEPDGFGYVPHFASCGR